jgi:sulfur-carrier protein
VAVIHFAAHLWAVAASDVLAAGQSVGDTLASAFGQIRQLKGYVLDEQGRLRQHVCIFLDGERLPNATARSAPLRDDSEIYVMQALSGG